MPKLILIRGPRKPKSESINRSSCNYLILLVQYSDGLYVEQLNCGPQNCRLLPKCRETS